MPKDKVPAPQSNPDPLITQRSNLKKQLIAFERHLRIINANNLTEESVADLEFFVAKLKPCINTFNALQKEIEIKQEIEYDDNERNSFHAQYFN